MLGFNEEIQNGTTKVSKVWLDITLADGTVLNLTEDNVLMSGLTRDTSTTVDGEFTVGAAVTGKLSVVVFNEDESLSPYDFRGGKIVAYLGGILSDETIEKINIGRYYIDEYTYDGTCINLTAYDDMAQFDVPCKDANISWSSDGKTIYQLIQSAMSVTSDLGLWNSQQSLPGPANYKVTQIPKQWETMTCHDIIAYCAQIMCCFARIVYVQNPGQYQLKFEWYDTGAMRFPIYDGGTFTTTTTPYSDGVSLDGGTFDPWNTGDVVDEGTFGNRQNLHLVSAPYDLTVDTDDVLITGTTVELAASDNINATDDTQDYTTDLYGDEGYIISISGNPLIETTGQADAVAEYIGDNIIGMRFRPLSASAIENPSMEAGDVGLVYGRNQNMYPCFFSHVVYTVNSATSISCDAASTMQNLKGRYTGAQKTYALMQRNFDRSISSAEMAMSGIMGALSTTMGLNYFPDTDDEGRTIYRFGNGSTIETSEIQWKFSAGAMMVSSDYGEHWNGAFSNEGIAVLKEVYAVKVNADYIETGTLTVGGISKGIGTIYIKDENNTVLGVVDDYGIHYGKESVYDNDTTGFYLASSGFIVGNVDNDVFFRITPGAGQFDNLVTVRDNPYPTGSTSTAATTFSISSNYGTTNLGSVYSAFGGDVDIGGDLDVDGQIHNSSDRRLKEHIDYLGDDALEFIRQLKPVHYQRKGNSEIGFYAQDVEDADQWDCMTGENKGYKTLNYIEIIAPLVKYCQSLEERIEELEGRLNGNPE